MGDICRMHDANRAAAVLEEDPAFVASAERYIGATVERSHICVNDSECGTIGIELVLRLADGTEAYVMAERQETSEDGVCGFELERDYTKADLRRMLKAAIKREGNGLDDDDRESLREDLRELGNYYPAAS